MAELLDAPQSDAVREALLDALTAAPAETPAPDETPSTPANTAPAPAAETTPDPNATPPDAQTPPPAPEPTARERELADRLARLEASYNGNLQQKDAELARHREQLATAQKAQADAAAATQQQRETDWRGQVDAWEAAYKRIDDPQAQQTARLWIDAQVKDHEADRKAAEADALRQRTEPVAQRLAMQQVMGQLDQAAKQTVQQFQTQGAEALATTHGIPVEEVRQYLSREDVSQRLQRAFVTTQLYGTTALLDYAQEIGERFAALAAKREAAETQQIDANRAAVAGANRDTGANGAGAPKREIKTFADVTSEDWHAALAKSG